MVKFSLKEKKFLHAITVTSRFREVLQCQLNSQFEGFNLRLNLTFLICKDDFVIEPIARKTVVLIFITPFMAS